MSQAVMDPEQVRRFAEELQRFNRDLQARMSSLQARFTSLSDTWQDQEYQKFSEEFQQTSKALKRFFDLSEQQIPYLLRKAQKIDDYLKAALMKGQAAGVSSIDSIERFRALLIVYRDKIKPLLADASDEVSRTREWVRIDRRTFWETEVRRRKRILEQAEQAFFSARFSNLRQATTAEQTDVHRAERALAEAEQKLAVVRKWILAFDQQVGPLIKQLEQLRTIATDDVAKGEEFLARILAELNSYLTTAAPIQPEKKDT